MAQLDRDVAMLALINKAMEINTISMNYSTDARYHNIGTLLCNIKQTMEDGIRETYVDGPMEEVDTSKFTKSISNTDVDSDTE